MDDEARHRIALWRFGVLGPLVSARLEHGDRRLVSRCGGACTAPERTVGAALRAHDRGLVLGVSQGWASGARAETRADCGQSRAISAEVADLLLRAKREKPRRSIRRLIRMLGAPARCARAS
ncbi:MAG: hypothetical protein IPM35_28015 [Myxococcales bacterium]|nr:hypothetical protein [Myxococcales bacterium]